MCTRGPLREKLLGGLERAMSGFGATEIRALRLPWPPTSQISKPARLCWSVLESLPDDALSWRRGVLSRAAGNGRNSAPGRHVLHHSSLVALSPRADWPDSPDVDPRSVYEQNAAQCQHLYRALETPWRSVGTSFSPLRLRQGQFFPRDMMRVRESRPSALALAALCASAAALAVVVMGRGRSLELCAGGCMTHGIPGESRSPPLCTLPTHVLPCCYRADPAHPSRAHRPSRSADAGSGASHPSLAVQDAGAAGCGRGGEEGEGAAARCIQLR